MRILLLSVILSALQMGGIAPANAQDWRFDNGSLDRFMSKADQEDCAWTIFRYWKREYQQGLVCIKNHVSDPNLEVACWNLDAGSREACTQLLVRSRESGSGRCDHGTRTSFWMDARDPNLGKDADKYGYKWINEGSREYPHAGPFGKQLCNGHDNLNSDGGYGVWSCHRYNCCCTRR